MLGAHAYDDYEGATLSFPSLRPRLLEGSIILWAIITMPLAVFMAVNTDRGWVLMAIAAGPVAWLCRRRPYVVAAVLVAGAMVLRLSFVGLTSSDPIAVSQLAAVRAVSGENPYGVTYGDNNPYVYGPLGLLTYQAGIPGEVLATVATSAVLAWSGAWITLALFNAWPQFIYMPIIGNNDFSVGFLTLLALVLLRQRPLVGVGLLAVAIAIKPYAAAWAIPAAVFAGWGGAAVGAILTLLLWAPVLLLWGVPSFLRSVTTAAALQSSLPGIPSWSFADLPVLRLLIVPFSLAAFAWRSWRAVLLLGSAGFVAFLGFAPAAPQPYLGLLLPILGLALESSGRAVDYVQGRPT